MFPYAFTRNHMYDIVSFFSANLRLMKNHWKNKGAPLGGMGGDRLSWTICFAFLRCIYKGRGLRSAATDKGAPDPLYDLRLTKGGTHTQRTQSSVNQTFQWQLDLPLS